MNRKLFLILTLTLTTLMLPPRMARGATIELTVDDLVQVAAIHADAPNLGWAATTYGNGYFTSTPLTVDRMGASLFQYDLSSIPEDMRITHAQWHLPQYKGSTPQTTLQLWRLTNGWGPGVSYMYRTTVPEPVAWDQPGAGALGGDRTIRPTATSAVSEDAGELVINVTRDVELWHSGVEPNHGWLLTVDQDRVRALFESPLYLGREQWILRITYEPR